jgi:hypothetical protein
MLRAFMTRVMLIYDGMTHSPVGVCNKAVPT